MAGLVMAGLVMAGRKFCLLTILFPFIFRLFLRRKLRKLPSGGRRLPISCTQTAR
jgi:hypothetical protein